jgi:hypothetical protein
MPLCCCCVLEAGFFSRMESMDVFAGTEQSLDMPSAFVRFLLGRVHPLVTCPVEMCVIFPQFCQHQMVTVHLHKELSLAVLTFVHL